MRKFFVTVAVALMSLTTMNAANIDVTTVDRLNTMSTTYTSISAETPTYSVDFNTHYNRLVDYFDLNQSQSDMLFDVHKVIKKEMMNLYKIDDPEQRTKQFFNVIYYWRQHAYNAFMAIDSLDKESEQIARANYRNYWFLVVTTLKNRGIVTKYDEFVADAVLASK